MSARIINKSENARLVMQAIWDKNPCYLGDIINALKFTPWNKTTISTMVNRLVWKNLIMVKKLTNTLFLYTPLISEKEAMEIYTRAFIERVFKCDAAKLIEMLAEDNEFTKKEKADIKGSFAGKDLG
ncbi:MAG: BlaI/MecI/CopY family transcriptional regulator [Saccharofermentanales bacterium]